MFMEYCDRGTLDEVSRLGLPEDLVRRYTKELLIAVQVLHEHGIVHRDIKGTTNSIFGHKHQKSVRLLTLLLASGMVHSIITYC